MAQKLTHDEFAKKVVSFRGKNIELAGDYTGGRSPVLCRCLDCGDTRPWKVKEAKTLLLNMSCPHKTSSRTRLTHDEFAKRVKKQRGKNIELMSEYKGMRTRIMCKCTRCGDNKPWSADPENLLITKSCPHQGSSKKLKPVDYKKRVEEISNNSITPVTAYVNAQTKVKHRCKKCVCGDSTPWETLPQHFLSYGMGCERRNRYERSQEMNVRYRKICLLLSIEPLEQISKFHLRQNTLHKCLICKESFSTYPCYVSEGRRIKIGCDNCQPKTDLGHSRVAIQWLDDLAKEKKIKIRHAGNGGEYRIPHTRYRADGYHKPTNTIYEFYGDCFHGNLDVHKPRSKPNPFSDLTAKQLFEATMRREGELKALGYTVVAIWEKDYREALLNM